MLRQEISWFDEERNSSGILTTRLSQDASRVQGATGTRFGTLLEAGVAALVSVVLAFIYSWMLTLVLVVFVPIMMVAGFIRITATSGTAKRNKESLEQAGGIALDAISNIRTVKSLGIELKFYDNYSIEVNRIFW
jgi:ABC-type bacteriocin/lantibiotic exporter with double-glycine peptidase domain